MIEEATSINFIRQIPGTYNRPIISLCRTRTGIQTYFLKYARTQSEFDGLLSEIICQKIAKLLHLNTPEIALVKIGNHPIDPDKIKFSDKLNNGLLIFG
ncbi:MAG TPA: hypothetical protein VE912_19280, partial [Bacteroidales bacterium]|nr:hypothetical protein [Bacteroidales bacterium]